MGEFSKGVFPAFNCRVTTNYNTCQPHLLAPPSRKRASYSMMCVLCDNVLTMGAGAFQGTGMGSGELDGDGSVEEEERRMSRGRGRMS